MKEIKYVNKEHPADIIEVKNFHSTFVSKKGCFDSVVTKIVEDFENKCTKTIDSIE